MELKRSKSKGENWYHPKANWWDVSDSETEIPCKEVMPAPPRNLNTVDKDKYKISQYLHAGSLRGEMRK